LRSSSSSFLVHSLDVCSTFIRFSLGLRTEPIFGHTQLFPCLSSEPTPPIGIKWRAKKSSAEPNTKVRALQEVPLNTWNKPRYDRATGRSATVSWFSRGRFPFVVLKYLQKGDFNKKSKFLNVRQRKNLTTRQSFGRRVMRARADRAHPYQPNAKPHSFTPTPVPPANHSHPQTLPTATAPTPSHPQV
jgi:hypothetical protein